MGTWNRFQAALGRTFRGHEDSLIPDDLDIPPQIPVKKPVELPESFKKSDTQLNEEATTRSDLIRRF